MTEFQATWLDLREAADHRSRILAIARALSDAFAARRPISIVDLGCGTGSNVRATAPLLGPEQTWTLVDAAPALLDAAVDRLSAWADSAHWREGVLVLDKGARRISIGLRRADLAHELEAALPRDVQLVTASALFDLVSAAFIDRLVRALAARGAALFAALTYDGEQRWAPPSDTDAAVCAAFNAHQRSDKGFGPAAGPEAGRLLGDALARAGYEVREGESAWE